jgi:hypothetical protein
MPHANFLKRPERRTIGHKLLPMKVLFVLCLFITTTANSQTDTLWRKGNNTFRLTVKSLQSYFTKPYTISQFEKTLGGYSRKWYSSDTTFYLDNYTHVRTGEYKVTMPYNLLYNDFTFDVIYVDYNQNKMLESIRFEIEEKHVRIDALGDFMKQLTAAGYEYDLVSNRIYSRFGDMKTYFYHKIYKVLIGINSVNEYKSFVEVKKR